MSISPGESRTVALTLPGRSGTAAPDDALPAFVTVGRHPGPRLTILAAPRGFETVSVVVARAVATEISNLHISGSVIVVPLLRPGARFSAGGRPLEAAAAWRFPGDVGGTKRQREAFSIFSETCVGSTAVVVLTAPVPGRSGLSFARGDLRDPRSRRLMMQAGLAAAVHASSTVAGSLAAAAREIGSTLIELVAPSFEWTPTSATTLLESIRRLMDALGLTPAPPHAPPAPAPVSPPRAPTFSRVLNVIAGCGGLVEIHGRPGQGFRRGELLGQISPLSQHPVLPIACPRDAVILECPSTSHTGARRGSILFRLAVGTRSIRSLLGARPPATDDSLDDHMGSEESADAMPSPVRVHGPEMRVGWVERIALPLLGIGRLKAKIDTGARTSALHVSKIRPVGTGAGPSHRPILEITIPHGAPGGNHSVVVRAPVREFVQVKDTSGRTERRPVIETTFRLGTLERRIRVTLTDRADMLFPMLIGRTALGVGVIVDPARRYLVRQSPPAPRTPAKIVPES